MLLVITSNDISLWNGNGKWNFHAQKLQHLDFAQGLT